MIRSGSLSSCRRRRGRTAPSCPHCQRPPRPAYAPVRKGPIIKPCPGVGVRGKLGGATATTTAWISEPSNTSASRAGAGASHSLRHQPHRPLGDRIADIAIADLRLIGTRRFAKRILAQRNRPRPFAEPTQKHRNATPRARLISRRTLSSRAPQRCRTRRLLFRSPGQAPGQRSPTGYSQVHQRCRGHEKGRSAPLLQKRAPRPRFGDPTSQCFQASSVFLGKLRDAIT